jgi:hypothetical protein
MLRALALVLTTVLMFGIFACTSADKQANVRTADGTPATTPTPPTTPSPAPSPASVKGTGPPNVKWTDSASGTNVTTIKVGGTVTWTAVGTHKLAHDPATADNGCDELDASFDSTPIVQPVSRTFNKAGTFGYHCGIHGGTPNCKNPADSKGMSAVIKVVP